MICLLCFNVGIGVVGSSQPLAMEQSREEEREITHNMAWRVRKVLQIVT